MATHEWQVRLEKGMSELDTAVQTLQAQVAGLQQKVAALDRNQTQNYTGRGDANLSLAKELALDQSRAQSTGTGEPDEAKADDQAETSGQSTGTGETDANDDGAG